jgi:hypothetical protein
MTPSKKFIHGIMTFSILIIFPIATLVLYIYPINDFFWSGYNEKPMIKEMISVIPSINGSFIILPETEFLDYYFDGKPFYCYGAIYYNLSTPSGWFEPAAKASRIESIKILDQAVRTGNCSIILSISKDINTDEIISYEQYCKRIENCSGLALKMEREHVCVFDVV